MNTSSVKADYPILVCAAEASAKEFEETGLHVTFDEMSSWVESWGSDNEKPMPICHK